MLICHFSLIKRKGKQNTETSERGKSLGTMDEYASSSNMMSSLLVQDKLLYGKRKIDQDHKLEDILGSLGQQGDRHHAITLFINIAGTSRSKTRNIPKQIDAQWGVHKVNLTDKDFSEESDTISQSKLQSYDSN